MKNYIVIQHGVYRHDIWGPYTEEHAVSVSLTLAEKDVDDYHEYEVHQLDGHLPDGALPTFHASHKPKEAEGCQSK